MSQKPKPLTASRVFARIRPQATEGGHAQTGHTAAAKAIHSWDDKSVYVGWSCSNNNDMGHALKEAERYPYAGVMAPDCTQEDVYEATAAPLVEQLTAEKPTDALYFAYGQTGCGKTHTMLGTDASLRSAPSDGAVHANWGIFPRVVYGLFETLQAKGQPFVVSFSAVEFYLGVANDLLAGNSPIALSQEHEPLGLTQFVLTTPQSVVGLLAMARDARHTRTTRMNLSGAKGTDAEHGGSSRGHAMLILNVSRLDTPSGKSVGSTFTMVDLAGAERPDKTGAERKSGMDTYEEVTKYFAAQKEGREIPLSIGAQAFCINFELYSLLDMVAMATDYNRTKKGVGPPYRPSSITVTDAVRMMGRCFSGAATLTVVVTLSQAPQCGWESWFSCKYGQTLAKLRAPVQTRSWSSLSKQVQTQLGAISENLAALSRPIANKTVTWKRAGAITTARFTLVTLRALAKQHPDPSQLGVDPKNCESWGIPPAPTTGFSFASSSELQSQYQLDGDWNTAALEIAVQESSLYLPTVGEEFMKMPIEVQRNFVDKQMKFLTFEPVNAAWLAACPVTQKITVDTTPYSPCDNPAVSVRVHQPATGEAPASGRPVLVFAHGGGGTFTNAKQHDTIAARYAGQCNAIVLNVDYRLAPENPCPAGIFDVTGVVLFARDNAVSLGGDPNRICVFGESGGGYITGGVAVELARRDLSHVVRLCVPIGPQVSDIIFTDTQAIEGGALGRLLWKDAERMISGGKKPAELGWLWPAKTSKKNLSKFPPTAIMTAEFDLCRRMAEDLAAKLIEAGGPLVDFVVHPTAQHCFQNMMSAPYAEEFYRDFATLVAKYAT